MDKLTTEKLKSEGEMKNDITSRNESTAVTEPEDAAERRAVKPVICYKVENLPFVNMNLYKKARRTLQPHQTIIVPPREARTFHVPAGYFFRIISMEGPQVGDLNLWNANNMKECFYSSKTRQLHSTHLTTGDRLWTGMPWIRPMATITFDSLEWYGYDDDGAGVHDVIGSRCDPYTNYRLNKENYNNCCHSNLTRSMINELGFDPNEGENLVHDVFNVFMCTGFSLTTRQYFMKASPVRPGDFIEFFAEMDIIGSLSTCPGGDCGASHSDDQTDCYPLKIEICKPSEASLEGWKPSDHSDQYSGAHGLNFKQQNMKMATILPNKLPLTS